MTLYGCASAESHTCVQLSHYPVSFTFSALDMEYTAVCASATLLQQAARRTRSTLKGQELIDKPARRTDGHGVAQAERDGCVHHRAVPSHSDRQLSCIRRLDYATACSGIGVGSVGASLVWGTLVPVGITAFSFGRGQNAIRASTCDIIWLDKVWRSTLLKDVGSLVPVGRL